MWTTDELADELDVDTGRLSRIARRWGWTRDGERWSFTEEQADRLRAHVIAYGGNHALPRPPCSVDGCDRPHHARRLCRMHLQRLERTGTLEPGRPGDNQRAKLRCPAGHEYTPANTYTFADGRRRCRTCRLEQSTQSTRARRARRWAETADA